MKQTKDAKENPRLVFATLDGREIHFVPFSWDEYQLARAGLMEEYRKRGDPIDCPQYTVTFASGKQEKFDHDAGSIKTPPPDTPPEDVESVLAEQKAVWDAYLETTARFNAEDQELLSTFVYEDSLGSIPLPDDGSWEEKQRRRHISIPEEPEEKRQHYINTVLIKAKSDQMDLLAQVVAVSMGIVKEDDLERVKASFRNQIWGDKIQQLFGRGTVGEVETPAVRQVGEQPAVDAGAGKEAVATDES